MSKYSTKCLSKAVLGRYTASEPLHHHDATSPLFTTAAALTNSAVHQRPDRLCLLREIFLCLFDKRPLACRQPSTCNQPGQLPVTQQHTTVPLLSVALLRHMITQPWLWLVFSVRWLDTATGCSTALVSLLCSVILLLLTLRLLATLITRATACGSLFMNSMMVALRAMSLFVPAVDCAAACVSWPQ